MPSDAFKNFYKTIKKSNRLDSPIITTEFSIAERQVFYHACISMDVAAWDSYINNVIKEYHQRIGDFRNPTLLHNRTILEFAIKRKLEKFNTPNFDNCRNIIIECTGFDPVGIWSWQKKGMIWQSVQSRLNETLRIRHSFAHGFQMPNYAWLPGAKDKNI